MTETGDGRRVVLLTLMCVVVVFQTVAIVRYWQRLPQDWLGIGLYAATIVLAGIGILVTSRQLGE